MKPDDDEDEGEEREPNKHRTTYEVTVLVPNQNYRKTFTVQASSEGFAKTRVIKLATDGNLRLNGDLVEYIVKKA
jgi:hypothetical protein